jgi:hypothetical protein
MTGAELIVLSFLALSPYQMPVCTPADPRGMRWMLHVLRDGCEKKKGDYGYIDRMHLAMSCQRRIRI